MSFKTITSLAHPIVKHFVELRKEKNARVLAKEVVISGETVIRELAQKKSLHVLMSLEERFDIKAQETYIVTPEILKKVTGVVEPDGFAASIAMPEEEDLEKKQRILILDQIVDPGNLGTLFRTALAFGWEGVWLTPGTVDPFNDKALRASRGAVFWLPFAYKEFEEICLWKEKEKAFLYIADLEGTPVEKAPLKFPAALILSHESRGAGLWPGQKITISMQREVESLNVAISGGILLFALRKSL